LTQFRYEFSVPLFAFFKCALRHLLANPPMDAQNMSPADLIAQAVFRTAWMYGTPLPNPDRDRGELWPRNRPICEAWLRLGKYEPLSGAEIMTKEELSDGTLRFPSPGFLLPRIAQRISYSTDKNKLPKIVIEIEGEPVCILYKSRYNLRDLEERTSVRAEAKRMLDCLIKDLLVNFQVKYSRANRPLINLGQEAAYLHDHRRLSWREVANQICPRKHSHDFTCRTNLRKQAEHWYRRNVTAIMKREPPEW
jgi:hypothetical protein